MSETEDKKALAGFFAEQRKINAERLAAVELAVPALERLCNVMCDRSGQCYKIRDLLYSLWNGQPTNLSEVLNLDWEIRKDFCAVVLAFGFEETKFGKDGSITHGIEFFYDAMTAALKKVGQYTWFLEAYCEREEAA